MYLPQNYVISTSRTLFLTDAHTICTPVNIHNNVSPIYICICIFEHFKNDMTSHIKEDLTWTTNTTSLSKKAQQRLHFLRRLKRASLPPPILTTFYRESRTIESVLTSCITVWYENYSAADHKTLQRTVNTAAKIIGVPLPSILDIFLARCSSKANSIVKDPTQLFPPGCESPELTSLHPSLKPQTNPYLL